MLFLEAHIYTLQPRSSSNFSFFVIVLRSNPHFHMPRGNFCCVISPFVTTTQGLDNWILQLPRPVPDNGNICTSRKLEPTGDDCDDALATKLQSARSRSTCGKRSLGPNPDWIVLRSSGEDWFNILDSCSLQISLFKYLCLRLMRRLLVQFTFFD